MSVLSGNRNFEARIHQNVKGNFLMSPILVVIYAIAGKIDIDLNTEPLGISKEGKPVFNGENYYDLIHSRNNKLYRNIAVECNARLEEGGALYSWHPGKGNQYIENVVYKSHTLPGSSILALDDASGYFTLTGNVVWVEGRAGCGTIGVRPGEPGNVYTGNIRAFDKYNDASHCTGEPGRESFDKLYNTIKTEVDKAGGWPGNPDINAWIEKLKGQKRFELSPEEIKTMNKLL